MALTPEETVWTPEWWPWPVIGWEVDPKKVEKDERVELWKGMTLDEVLEKAKMGK